MEISEMVKSLPSATGRYSITANRTVQGMYRELSLLLSWGNLETLEAIREVVEKISSMLERGVEVCAEEEMDRAFSFRDAKDIFQSARFLILERMSELTPVERDG